MTANIQLSAKANDGKIFVVGGDNFDDFYVNLVAVNGGDTAATDAIINEAKQLLAPVSAERAALDNARKAFPQAQPQQDPWGDPPVPPRQDLNTQRGQTTGPPPGPAPLDANGNPKRWVPPGVSKKTGKPFAGFWAEDRPRGSW